MPLGVPPAPSERVREDTGCANRLPILEAQASAFPFSVIFQARSTRTVPSITAEANSRESRSWDVGMAGPLSHSVRFPDPATATIGSILRAQSNQGLSPFPTLMSHAAPPGHEGLLFVIFTLT
jgi:hypothetical protein